MKALIQLMATVLSNGPFIGKTQKLLHLGQCGEIDLVDRLLGLLALLAALVVLGARVVGGGEGDPFDLHGRADTAQILFEDVRKATVVSADRAAARGLIVQNDGAIAEQDLLRDLRLDEGFDVLGGERCEVALAARADEIDRELFSPQCLKKSSDRRGVTAEADEEVAIRIEFSEEDLHGSLELGVHLVVNKALLTNRDNAGGRKRGQGRVLGIERTAYVAARRRRARPAPRRGSGGRGRHGGEQQKCAETQ